MCITSRYIRRLSASLSRRAPTNRKLTNIEKTHCKFLQCVCVYFATQVCKPGSVLTAIYLVPRSLTGSSHLLEAGRANLICFSTALLRIEFTAPRCSHGAGGLLHRLFILTDRNGRRYLSVALVLGSPPAGITCYPCPTEPGLSSPAAFPLAAAAVRPGRVHIVPQESQLVKHLAKSSDRGYTIKRNHIPIHRCVYRTTL